MFFFFFFFKQKTAYEMLRSLVGSEMCIRDRDMGGPDRSDAYEKAVEYAEKRARAEELSDEQLKEFEKMVVMTEETLNKQLTVDEIKIQEKRLKDLEDLKELMIDLHGKVNSSSKNQDEISKKCKEVIELTYASKQDLKSAYEYKRALQRKKLSFGIGILVGLIAAGLIIYFLVK
eukprot:TRINITY_DN5459_c0_g1_i3.p1 TRINITY_DN5459_c0_g1~~TRINITY_DN5459_c0_g1_i3.p1  ORF type:complete len:175 (+),score=97.16 TRINITY_DN5459_c0_g1_i3:103-627(+)